MHLNLQEAEKASSRFKMCPKCSSPEGFWLGFKRDHAYAQCKSCGARFEIYEIYKVGRSGEKLEKLDLIRR